MTVPVTANTNTSRADAAAQFKTQVTDPVNAIPKWHAGSHPAGANAPLGGLSSASPSLLNAVLLNTNTITTNPDGSQILAGNMDGTGVDTSSYVFGGASGVGSLFQATARTLSRARLVRLVKYYNNTVGAGNYVFFDQTAVSHMNSAFQLGSTGVANPTGTVSASAFGTFITQLQTAITNHRNTLLTYTEQWCHSSCHSSHSSRGRR